MFFLAALVLGGPIAASGPLPVPSELVVFGDSFSDLGELMPPEQPTGVAYFGDRAHNGYLWWELLVRDLGIPTDNPAIGGGTSRSVLEEQVPFYRQMTGTVDPNALFVLIVGTNDILDDALVFGTPGPARDQAIQELVEHLGGLVKVMTELGAKRFLLTTQPDVTVLPIVMSEPELAALAAGLSTVDDQINAQLRTKLPELAKALGVEITLFDLDGLLSDVIVRPEAYGLENVTTPALSEAGVVANPDRYLWWDVIHPSAAFHRILAGKLRLRFAARPAS